MKFRDWFFTRPPPVVVDHELEHALDVEKDNLGIAVLGMSDAVTALKAERGAREGIIGLLEDTLKKIERRK